jgi:hypothetical protein
VIGIMEGRFGQKSENSDRRTSAAWTSVWLLID